MISNQQLLLEQRGRPNQTLDVCGRSVLLAARESFKGEHGRARQLKRAASAVSCVPGATQRRYSRQHPHPILSLSIQSNAVASTLPS